MTLPTTKFQNHGLLPTTLHHIINNSIYFTCSSAHDYIYRGPNDLIQLLHKLKPMLKKVLLEKFEEQGPFKFYFAIHAQFYGKSEEFEHILRSETHVFLTPDDFEDIWNQSTNRIKENFDEFLGTL